MTTPTYVSYYRVSTKRQGVSGLGLDAQRQTVGDYVDGRGWDLAGEFTEIDSGKRNRRPELQKALAMAKARKATVVIAKMDRLGRRASYVLNLLDYSGVRFVFAEMPNASDLEVGIRAVIAQEEGRVISERTKAALAAAKRRGVKLGTYGTVLAAKNQAAAQDTARRVALVIHELRAQKISSVRAVAAALTERGVPTARGGTRWHVQTVHRLMRRIRRAPHPSRG